MKNKKPVLIALGVVALIGIVAVGIFADAGDLFQGRLRYRFNRSKPVNTNITKTLFSKVPNSTKVQTNNYDGIKFITPLTLKVTAGSNGFQLGDISTYLYSSDSDIVPATCNYSLQKNNLSYGSFLNDNQPVNFNGQSGVFKYQPNNTYGKTASKLAANETGTLDLVCYLSPGLETYSDDSWNAEIRAITDSANKVTYSVSNKTLQAIKGDQIKEQSSSYNNLQFNLSSCKLLKGWYQEGKLTSNISKYGTDMNMPSRCAQTYPEIWFDSSWDKCSIMYSWKTAYGIIALSSKMSEAGYTAADSQYCASVIKGWY